MKDILNFYVIDLNSPLLYDLDNGMIPEIVEDIRDLEISNICSVIETNQYVYDLYAYEYTRHFLTVSLDKKFENSYYLEKVGNNYRKI